MIRVFLSIKKLEKEIEVKEQEIKEIKREGFTVVELVITIMIFC